MFVSVADLVDQDYIPRETTVNIQSDETRGCTQYGSVDDNLSPILEDVEFYQISLTSDDDADVIPELAIASIFIEDNDGKISLIFVKTCYEKALMVLVYVALSKILMPFSLQYCQALLCPFQQLVSPSWKEMKETQQQ